MKKHYHHLLTNRGALKRAPLHRASLRPTRAYPEHASDAPVTRSTDFYASLDFQTGGLRKNAKNSVLKTYSIVKNWYEPT